MTSSHLVASRYFRDRDLPSRSPPLSYAATPFFSLIVGLAFGAGLGVFWREALGLILRLFS